MAQIHHDNDNFFDSVMGDIPFEGRDQASSSPLQDKEVPRAHGATRLGLRGDRRAIMACLLVLGVLSAFCLIRYSGVMRGFGIERADPEGDGMLGVETLDQDSEGSSVTDGEAEQEEPAGEVVVHVDGAVLQPGLYHVFAPSARVGDAIELAGGLTDDADTSTINLAEPLVDGMKIHVSAMGEEATPTVVGMAATESAEGTGAGSTALVNLNTASVTELVTLPGVGEVTAKAIIADREQHGFYTSVDELVRVDGIGEKRLAKLRDLVCI